MVNTTLRDAFHLAPHHAAVLVVCAGDTTGATVVAVYFDACPSTVQVIGFIASTSASLHGAHARALRRVVCAAYTQGAAVIHDAIVGGVSAT